MTAASPTPRVNGAVGGGLPQDAELEADVLHLVLKASEADVAEAGVMLGLLSESMFHDWRNVEVVRLLATLPKEEAELSRDALLEAVAASARPEVNALAPHVLNLADRVVTRDFQDIRLHLTRLAGERAAAEARDEMLTKRRGPARHGSSEDSLCSLSALPPGSDADRASRFVDRFSDRIRYVPEWKRWIVFDGSRWQARDDGGLTRLSVKLASEILRQFDGSRSGPGAEEEIKRLSKEAQSFSNAGKVEAMAAFARCDQRVVASPSDIDADPWVVGAPNGVVDLRNGTMTPHSPDRIITRFLGCDFNPTATAPTWTAFLERVIPDVEVRVYLQKAAGYSLTGVTTEHHFVFLYGTGANGKSTFLETLSGVFADYAHRAAESLLYSADRGVTPPDVVAEVAGVRLLLGSETREGARLNEGAIKDLTGGDTLRGARKYEHGFRFKPVAKLWIAGNHRPAIRGNDDGIWRRVRLVDFPVQIPEAERDPGLPARLMTEGPGILNWLIAGCLAWQRDGLKAPTTVQASVADYRQDEDVLGDFLSERTEPFPSASVSHSNLFQSYQGWCESGGIRYALSNRVLAKRLRERGWVEGDGTRGAKIWRGVRLLTDRP